MVQNGIKKNIYLMRKICRNHKKTETKAVLVLSKLNEFDAITVEIAHGEVL